MFLKENERQNVIANNKFLHKLYMDKLVDINETVEKMVLVKKNAGYTPAQKAEKIIKDLNSLALLMEMVCKKCVEVNKYLETNKLAKEYVLEEMLSCIADYLTDIENYVID